jgi:hypothetical protein
VRRYLFSALRQHGVPSRHQPFDFQAGGAQGAGGGGRSVALRSSERRFGEQSKPMREVSF